MIAPIRRNSELVAGWSGRDAIEFAVRFPHGTQSIHHSEVIQFNGTVLRRQEELRVGSVKPSGDRVRFRPEYELQTCPVRIRPVNTNDYYREYST